MLIAVGSGAGSSERGGSRRGGQGSRRGESHRSSNGVIIEGVKSCFSEIIGKCWGLVVVLLLADNNLAAIELEDERLCY